VVPEPGAFHGTSDNAAGTRIRIAASAYLLLLLLAIIRKRLDLDLSLYAILRILGIAPFERMPSNQTLSEAECKPRHP